MQQNCHQLKEKDSPSKIKNQAYFSEKDWPRKRVLMDGDYLKDANGRIFQAILFGLYEDCSSYPNKVWVQSINHQTPKEMVSTIIDPIQLKSFFVDRAFVIINEP